MALPQLRLTPGKRLKMANDVLLSFTCVGSAGKPKTIPVWLPAASTLADATTYAQAFVTAVEDCIDPYVQKASVIFEIDISGQTKAAPDGTTRTHDGARFLFDTAGRYGAGVWFPGWKPAFLSDTDIVVALATTALKAAFTAGLGGIAPTDGNGNDITAFLKGKFAYRK